MKPSRHLDETTLLSYSAGSLPTAMNVVASAHLSRCRVCRDNLIQIDHIGGVLLQQQQTETVVSDSARQAMMALLDKMPDPVIEPFDTESMPSDDPDLLPAPLHPWFGTSMQALRWRWVAPGVHRIRAADVSDGDLMLLKIAPGSKLPLHSHGGSELTMILDGAYDDLLGHFGPGDVADLDEDTWHQPVTSPGIPCVCVAATDAPLVFSGRIARALQSLVGF